MERLSGSHCAGSVVLSLLLWVGAFERVEGTAAWGEQWVGDPYAAADFSEVIAGNHPLVGPSVMQMSGLHTELLPSEILYPAYLAGPRESRIGTQVTGVLDEGALWDTTLGGHFGWFRYVPSGGQRIWQMDIEGAAILRLDPENRVDLESVDYRFGIPLTLAVGSHRFKFGYEHLSSHLGDEYMVRRSILTRDNYVREALVGGYSKYLTEKWRAYGEASWAFSRDISDPWHFQLGIEWAPTRPTGLRGEPYFAVHSLLREEVNFGGTTVVQAGWAWRDGRAARLLRTGFFYQTGKSSQMSFNQESETHVGAGIWYDF